MVFDLSLSKLFLARFTNPWLQRTQSMEKMIRSKKIFLQVSPHLPHHTIQKGFPAKLCLIFARIVPGIAVMEGVSVWPRERENFWTRPGYALIDSMYVQ
jgi:hypothetical protein